MSMYAATDKFLLLDRKISFDIYNINKLFPFYERKSQKIKSYIKSSISSEGQTQYIFFETPTTNEMPRVKRELHTFI